MNLIPDSTPPKPVPPDLEAAPARDWPRRTFPLGDIPRGPEIVIVIQRSVLNAVCRHGQEQSDVEICGVLVGGGFQDDQGPFLEVSGAIWGDHAANQASQVTFTSQTWEHIHQELDDRYADCRIIGWYHTHPGFGIFLSPMDLFIHQHFFNAPEQLALVYDPLQQELGLFAWHQGEAVRTQYMIAEDPSAPSPKCGFVDAHVASGNLLTGDLPDMDLSKRSRASGRCLALLSLLLVLLASVGILAARDLISVPWRRQAPAAAQMPASEKFPRSTEKESRIRDFADSPVPFERQSRSRKKSTTSPNPRSGDRND